MSLLEEATRGPKTEKTPLVGSVQFGGLPSYWVVLFFNHLDAVLSERSGCAGDACDRTPLVIAAEAAAARDAGA